MLLSFISCKGKTDKPINEESDMAGQISDNVEFRISDDNSKIWLNNSHIEKISLEEDQDGNKIMVFTTTEEGKGLLYDATSENLGKNLSMSADHYLLFSAMVPEPIADGNVTFSKRMMDYTYLFNYLTGAKDKMKGVTPPKDLVSEEEAKNKVFEYAGISADEATELSVRLEITEDYFGWQYCIDFEANGKGYITEVNAHTGGIIKF